MSRVGFSKNAKSKAKRLGITLCVASTAEKMLSELGFELPIEVVQVKLSRFNSSMSINIHTPTTFQKHEVLTISGVYVPDLLRSEVIDGRVALPEKTTSIIWAPTTLAPPYTISDSLGRKFPVDGVEFTVGIEVRHFFGHIAQIPTVLFHGEVDSEVFNFIIPSEDMPGIIDHLTEFTDSSEKHVDPLFRVCLIVTPESFHDIPLNVSFQRVDPSGTVDA